MTRRALQLFGWGAVLGAALSAALRLYIHHLLGRHVLDRAQFAGIQLADLALVLAVATVLFAALLALAARGRVAAIAAVAIHGVVSLVEVTFRGWMALHPPRTHAAMLLDEHATTAIAIALVVARVASALAILDAADRGRPFAIVAAIPALALIYRSSPVLGWTPLVTDGSLGVLAILLALAVAPDEPAALAPLRRQEAAAGLAVFRGATMVRMAVIVFLAVALGIVALAPRAPLIMPMSLAIVVDLLATVGLVVGAARFAAGSRGPAGAASTVLLGLAAFAQCWIVWTSLSFVGNQTEPDNLAAMAKVPYVGLAAGLLAVGGSSLILAGAREVAPALLARRLGLIALAVGAAGAASLVAQLRIQTAPVHLGDLVTIGLPAIACGVMLFTLFIASLREVVEKLRA